jgi:hypothetical protein
VEVEVERRVFDPERMVEGEGTPQTPPQRLEKVETSLDLVCHAVYGS